MELNNRKIIVTGGSRGLGLGIVEAFVAQGAHVTVVARGEADLHAVKSRLGVDTIAVDIADAGAGARILATVRPDLLVLNAGAPPVMAEIDRITWADFSANWDIDVKGTLVWTQAALNLPLTPGSRVLTLSSGAAISGSPMSGGYGGAKKMTWLIAQYANLFSEKRGLGIRFQTVVPRQMVAGTGTGDAGSLAYATANGITQAAFLERFGPPMPPRLFGDHIVAILQDSAYDKGFAFGVKAETGVTILEQGTA